jgi:hypothetical protein
MREARVAIGRLLSARPGKLLDPLIVKILSYEPGTNQVNVEVRIALVPSGSIGVGTGYPVE